MTSTNKPRELFSLFVYLVYTVTPGLTRTQFSSHVSIHTPTHSFSHGVGDPVTVLNTRNYQQRQPQLPIRSTIKPSKSQQPRGGGYPRVRPTVPFTIEDRPRSISVNSAPWQQRPNNAFIEQSIPLLSPSPYKVDSPDPESLWPEGLFLPPLNPPRFRPIAERRSDTDLDLFDPYLLEGTEAIVAVRRADTHGLLFFHDIPHIDSLLENQEIRLKNKLKPHRIASIRHTWPYNRP